MKLLNHTTEKGTLEFNRNELLLANAPTQDGRISRWCDSSEG